VVLRPARVVSGRVSDVATGRPIGGAQVTVYGDGGLWAMFTGADGGYRIDTLGAGLYSVAAARDGYAMEAGSGSANLDLRSAASARHDVSLRQRPGVRGYVRDEAGRPVDDAIVMPGLRGTPHIYAVDPFSGLGFGSSGSTRTAADGSFALVLDAGRDWLAGDIGKDRPLIVLKRGYAAARFDLNGRTGGGDAALRITLTRGMELAGRVRSAEGRPLPGVAVTLTEDGGAFGSTIPAYFVIANNKEEGWATTDSEGRFSARVHPAVHHLAFRGGGVAPRVVRGYDPRRGEPLEVVLEPAATLSGRVVRPDGRAVPDVAISLTQPESTNPESATTGADGRFEVKDLAPGAYELTAMQEKLGVNEKRPVQVPAAGWQLVLEATGAVRGHVVDAATRQPVKGFQAWVNWPAEPGGSAGGQHTEVEDATGAFSFADVPAREVSVRVSAEGYAPATVDEVAVAAGGETAELEVALAAEAPVRGRVTSEERAPLSRAVVRVAAGGAGQSVNAISDERGDYEVRGVAPGDLTLTFELAGFLGEKRKLDSRETTRLDVTLRRGLALSGVVVGEAALLPASVSATSKSRGAPAGHTRTDPQGRFTLAGLVPGRYDVRATADDGKGNGRLEGVDPETAGPLRIVLARAPRATLTGKVVGLSGAGELVFAQVNASNEEGDGGQALVDASGAFRMEEAPAGRLTVVAEASTPGTNRHSRAVEVTLAPGAEGQVVLEFAGNVVSGLVSREGRPVSGASVSFDGPGLVSTEAHTDLRGRYEVGGLEEGRYRVSVSGDGSSFATDFVVSGPGELDLDITGGGVAGTVVHAEGGAPLAGVTVTLWPAEARENTPGASAASNARGEFSFRSVREGPYRLTTSKAGFGQLVRNVEVVRGVTATVQLELSPAAGVTVSVVDAGDGQPLGATVVARDLTRRIVAGSHSDADEDGTVTIPLADGPYLLSVSATGYGTATVPVTAPSQGLRVALTPGGTLVIESARELRGRARLVQPDGEEYVQCCNGVADVELQGRRTIVEHVTPGSYTLEVLDGDEVAARTPVALREGQTTAVAID
jgi:protocatechuate 3,4-dioxygenase beta subunit